jgi:transposase
MTLPIVSVPTGSVSRRSTKRFFDVETKRRVVGEWDALEPYGPERGSLLRREGIVRRQVYEWRQAIEMNPGEKRGRGRPPKTSSLEAENERLRNRNVQLEAELVKNQKMLSIMGKAHALLDALTESADTGPKSPKS